MSRISGHHVGAVWGSSGLADRLGAGTGPALPDAACTRVDPEVFFPDREQDATTAVARQICVRCPARDACLDLFGDLPYGIVAGYTAAERRERRRQTVAAPPGALAA